jgi:hypothetical protein
MSDLATETQAYVDMVNEATRQIETLHGEISDAVGSWDDLFAAPIAALPDPVQIDDQIAGFDQGLTELGQAFHDTLCNAIEACETEFGGLETTVTVLQSAWDAQIGALHTELGSLAAQIGGHQQDLTKALTDELAAILIQSRDLFNSAIEPFVANAVDWIGELQGVLEVNYAAAWQAVTSALGGEHSGNSQQFVEAASGEAGQSFQAFLDSTVAALGDLGAGIGDSLEALSGHLGDSVSKMLDEAIRSIIASAIDTFKDTILEAIGVATIGQAITDALAVSGVLEVLIPLNLAIEAILRAIEIFKNPGSALGF